MTEIVVSSTAVGKGLQSVDLLMIVAAIGEVLDGGLLIVIFATSGALEAFLTQRTAGSVRSLLNLAPDRVTVVQASGDELFVDGAVWTPSVVDALRCSWFPPVRILGAATLITFAGVLASHTEQHRLAGARLAAVSVGLMIPTLPL
ncbi:hypothetical protein [Rhodococcus wratislaviensis]|uniref:hypothetical protein n=1 Tax=Rhodococcus wratislaviensis TaxID=44752 RepID=UPI00351401EA